jgi:O-antigen ligase
LSTGIATAPDKHALQPVILGLLMTGLVFAPLFRAGATPLASLALQLLALALLVLVFWSPRSAKLSAADMAIAAALLVLPLIYLLPLPASWVDTLPGRQLYADIRQFIAANGAGWRPLSLYPSATAAAALAILVPVAAFLAARVVGPAHLLRLVQVILAVAVFQAMLGLVQFGTAQSGAALFAVPGGHSTSGTGTYANRNHLAGLLEMALPLALALFFYSLGRRSDRSVGHGRQRRLASFIPRRANQALLYGAVALLIVVGMIFTRSRTGIFLAMLGIVLCTLLFARHLGGRNAFGATGTLLALVIGFGAAIGLAPVLDRFSVAGVVEDNRFTIFSASLLGIGQLFPIGSGPATYPSVFPILQPLELGRAVVNRAHNDYLEWIFDAGLFAALIIAIVLFLYLRQWLSLYKLPDWTMPRFVQMGAGVSLLLMALHEFLDYNLYMPANQVVFAVLAGIFFIPGAQIPREHKKRGTNAAPRPEPTRQVPGAAPTARGAGAPNADQIDNPFL